MWRVALLGGCQAAISTTGSVSAGRETDGPEALGAPEDAPQAPIVPPDMSWGMDLGHEPPDLASVPPDLGPEAPRPPHDAGPPDSAPPLRTCGDGLCTWPETGETCPSGCGRPAESPPVTCAGDCPTPCPVQSCRLQHGGGGCTPTATMAMIWHAVGDGSGLLQRLRVTFWPSGVSVAWEPRCALVPAGWLTFLGPPHQTHVAAFAEGCYGECGCALFAATGCAP